MPRTKPYTSIGIRRVPCLRCGEKSWYQWNICSLGTTYHGLCDQCDVGLNELVLRYMRIPDAEHIMEAYKLRVKAQTGQS